MKILRLVLMILALVSGAGGLVVFIQWGEQQDPILTLCIVVVALCCGLTVMGMP